MHSWVSAEWFPGVCDTEWCTSGPTQHGVCHASPGEIRDESDISLPSASQHDSFFPSFLSSHSLHLRTSWEFVTAFIGENDLRGYGWLREGSDTWDPLWSGANLYSSLRKPTILFLFQVLEIGFSLSFKFFLRSKCGNMLLLESNQGNRLEEKIRSQFNSSKLYRTRSHGLWTYKKMFLEFADSSCVIK